jgi:hypothetical protein
MRLTPAQLLVVPPAAVLAALLVCRRPQPVEPAPPEADPDAAALAAGWPEIVPLRLIVKGQLARDAADGRRRLVEVAALFRELNRLPPEVPEMPPEWYDSSVPIPVHTADDALCWQAVAQVRAALRDDPGRAAAAVARLEAEFREELRRQGAIRLPDPSTLEPVEELLKQARAWIAEQERRAARAGPRPTTR